MPKAAKELTLGGIHVLAAVTEGIDVGNSNRLAFVYSSQDMGENWDCREENKTKIRKIFRWDPEQRSKWGKG